MGRTRSHNRLYADQLQFNKFDVVERVLKFDARIANLPVAPSNQLPMALAIKYGALETLRVLLRYGACVSGIWSGCEARRSFRALGKRCGPFVELLGAYSDTECVSFAQSYQLFAFAATEGTADACVALRALGLDVESLDDDQMTPLDAAIYYRNHEAVQVLLALGADVGHRADDPTPPPPCSRFDGPVLPNELYTRLVMALLGGRDNAAGDDAVCVDIAYELMLAGSSAYSLISCRRRDRVAALEARLANRVQFDVDRAAFFDRRRRLQHAVAESAARVALLRWARFGNARLIDFAVALSSLDLPSLVTLAIFDVAEPTTRLVPAHIKHQIVLSVKTKWRNRQRD
eukprot:TRINITY_DN9128_c0_g1_i1.p1 TRINITY_DN9128_c0_g1~~TRINITY_DN9128_c0_g1_i1.p1  ORF type:complete len:359 (-),score=113.22 TRINITY_DN9128_c0_g1_i1:20-1057(-)